MAERLRCVRACCVGRQALRSFKDKIDTQEVPSQNFEAVRPFLKSPRFTHDAIVSKSKAAGGICSWVANIVAYYDIFCDVHPKRLLVARARTQLEGAQMRLGEVRGGEQVPLGRRWLACCSQRWRARVRPEWTRLNGELPYSKRNWMQSRLHSTPQPPLSRRRRLVLPSWPTASTVQTASSRH